MDRTLSFAAGNTKVEKKDRIRYTVVRKNGCFWKVFHPGSQDMAGSFLRIQER